MNVFILTARVEAVFLLPQYLQMLLYDRKQANKTTHGISNWLIMFLWTLTALVFTSVSSANGIFLKLYYFLRLSSAHLSWPVLKTAEFFPVCD